jgi:hypothetical protein
MVQPKSDDQYKALEEHTTTVRIRYATNSEHQKGGDTTMEYGCADLHNRTYGTLPFIRVLDGHEGVANVNGIVDAQAHRHL